MMTLTTKTELWNWQCRVCKLGFIGDDYTNCPVCRKFTKVIDVWPTTDIDLIWYDLGILPEPPKKDHPNEDHPNDGIARVNRWEQGE